MFNRIILHLFTAVVFFQFIVVSSNADHEVTTAVSDPTWFHEYSEMEQKVEDYLVRNPVPVRMMCGLGIMGVIERIEEVIRGTDIHDLIVLTDHRESYVRIASFNLLTEKNQSDPQAILDAYESGNTRTKFLLYTLVDKGDRDGHYEAFKALIDDPESPVFSWDEFFFAGDSGFDDQVREFRGSEYSLKLYERILTESTLPSERSVAARCLARYKDDAESIMPMMIDVLEDDTIFYDPRISNYGWYENNPLAVKISIIHTLGEYGENAVEAIPTLETLIAHPDDRVRIASMTSLYLTGYKKDEMVSGLIAMLGNLSNFSDMSYLVENLRTIGPDANAALPDIMSLLKEEPDNRGYAKAINDISGDPAIVVDVLNEAMRVSDPMTRRAIVNNYGYECLESERHTETLYEWFDDETDYNVRESIVYNLDRADPPVNEFLPYLIKYISENPGSSVIRMISDYGPEAYDALPALLNLYERTDINSILWYVVPQAIEKVGGSREMIMLKLVDLLRGTDQIPNEDRAFEWIGKQTDIINLAFPAIVDYIFSEDSNIHNYWITHALEIAIENLDVNSTNDYPWLLKVIYLDENELQTMAAHKSFAMSGSYDDAVDKLCELVLSDDMTTQKGGLDILSALGADAAGALPTLNWVLENGESHYDQSIRSIIEKIEAALAERGGSDN